MDPGFASGRFIPICPRCVAYAIDSPWIAQREPTEDDLIWPVLARPGWTSSLRQQNLSARVREDVPDGLLFADDGSKQRANHFAEEWMRSEHGVVIVVSKP